MSFVNRETELDFLRRMFARSEAQLLVIWGRRRVGKTALLREFGRERRLLYHVGRLSTEREELDRFSLEVATFFDDPMPRVQPFVSWEAAFTYLAGRASAGREPWGVALDEFPYLVEGSASLPSVLQTLWDERLKESGIKLVLCGSSVAMMEATLFAPSAPLYGRRTGQWRVEPFAPHQLGLMFPRKNLAELLELYSVIGGCPMYAALFDPKAKLAKNIRERVLTKGELLYEEVPFLLRAELREPRICQSILAALASGARKFAEISSKTGLDRGHLTRYLATLAELGLTRREVPITERRPEKSRRGLYTILDPFVRFWYRFVFPHLSRLEMGDADRLLKEQILPHLGTYVSEWVEGPIAALLTTGPLRDALPFEPAYVGRHWSPKEELDVVALDSTRTRAFVAEVKWSSRPVSTALAQKLMDRVSQCEALRDVEVTPALISKCGFRGTRTPDTVYLDLSAHRPSRSHR